MNDITKKRKIIIAIVLLAGLGISVYLSIIHQQMARTKGSAPALMFCTIGKNVDCLTVLGSKYAYLYDIPVAWIAIAGYTLMIGLLFFSTRKTVSGPHRYLSYLTLFVLISLLTSLYMAYVSVFIIEKICLFCSGLYLVNIILFIFCFKFIRHPTPTLGYIKEDIKSLFADLPRATITSLTIVLLLFGFLQYRSYFQKREIKKYQLDVYLDGTAPRTEIDITGYPSYGEKNAPLTIIEFVDYECSFCKTASLTIEKIMKRYPEKIRIVYIFFPLEKKCFPGLSKDYHPGACRTAMLGLAADRAGMFLDVHKHLFEGPHPWTDELLNKYIKTLDPKIQKEFSNEKSILLSIYASVALGRKYNIIRTPTFFINGMRVDGLLPDWMLEKVIQAELKRAGDNLK